eukprot:jgi/Psemu1/306733/fgenesh1_kg.277_\
MSSNLNCKLRVIARHSRLLPIGEKLCHRNYSYGEPTIFIVRIRVRVLYATFQSLRVRSRHLHSKVQFGLHASTYWSASEKSERKKARITAVNSSVPLSVSLLEVVVFKPIYMVAHVKHAGAS